MTQPRHPLRINIGFLIHQDIGVSRDIKFEFPRINLCSDLDVSQLMGHADIGRIPQGLLINGEFSGEVAVTCVRCLEVFQQPLDSSFNELFAFSPRFVTESNLILPESGVIDLEPLVHEYMMLEIPISPLCSQDCKGLCMVCGKSLNEGFCEHHQSLGSDIATDTKFGGKLREAISLKENS